MRPHALLGVGAGVWLPGFDVQLNNLLGESDIVHGEPQPGDHLESRMAPTLVFDGDGLELAIGSAGATRLRTALATVLGAILDEGLDAETAVALPRVHPTLDLVDAEPGVDEAARPARARGRTVRRWDRLHHYFGGVSCVGRAARPEIRVAAGQRTCRSYFRSSLSMRRDEIQSPTSPIASRYATLTSWNGPTSRSSASGRARCRGTAAGSGRSTSSTSG